MTTSNNNINILGKKLPEQKTSGTEKSPDYTVDYPGENQSTIQLKVKTVCFFIKSTGTCNEIH